MAPFSGTNFFISLSLKLFVIWQFLFFFPLWFLLSKTNCGKSFREKIITFSQLDKDYETIKSIIASVKYWVVGILKAILSRPSKAKYPFGYAILKKNGMYITSTNQYPYVIQLYDYLARKFMYLKTLSTFRVMEIEPTTEGGLEYLATTLKAASCLGVTTDEYSFRSLKKSNVNPRIKYVHSPKFDSVEIKQNNFDCIIGINVFEKTTIVDETLKLIKKSLKPSGYACLAEYLPVEQISVFEYCLKEAGLRIVKTENISASLSNAIKIQAKNESEQTFFKSMMLGYLEIKRAMNYILQQDNPHIDVLAELQMRRKFIAYIVESESE